MTRACESAKFLSTGGGRVRTLCDMGRRAESKQRTHDEILSAAEALFRERGYRATRVRDIARRVGVTEKTFFNYFQGKASLLHDLQIVWFRGEARRASEAYQCIADGSAGAGVLETLRADVRAQLRLFERDRGFWALVFTGHGARRRAPMTLAQRTELRAQQDANTEVLHRIDADPGPVQMLFKVVGSADLLPVITADIHVETIALIAKEMPDDELYLAL